MSSLRGSVWGHSAALVQTGLGVVAAVSCASSSAPGRGQRSAETMAAPAPLEGLSPSEIVALPERRSGDRRADALYRPVQLLEFLELGDGQRVADLSARDGYFSELLARTVGGSGRVYARSSASDQLSKAEKESWSQRTASAVMSVIAVDEAPWEGPFARGEKQLSLVFFFGYHQAVVAEADRARMNLAVHAALAPGGYFVVMDHHAPSAEVRVARQLARTDPAMVQTEVEAAGFALVGRGRFLENPQDDRTSHSGRLSVPTDRFILKFAKVSSDSKPAASRSKPLESGRVGGQKAP